MIEASRLLTYQARGLNHQAFNMESFRHVQTAGGDTAMKVTTEAVQIFGGYGYTKDYPVERYMRDAKSRKSMKALKKFKDLSSPECSRIDAKHLSVGSLL